MALPAGGSPGIHRGQRSSLRRIARQVEDGRRLHYIARVPIEQQPIRLEWSESDQPLEPAARSRIFGPGAPFELRRTEVRGRSQLVYAQRPRELAGLLSLADPQDRFLACADVELTYAEVRDRVGGLATALDDAHGVRPGDRVAVASAKFSRVCAHVLAVIAARAVVVGLNGWWAPPELAHGAALTDPVLVLADDARLERLRRAGVGAESLAAVVSAAPTSAELPSGLVDEDDPAVIMFTSGTTGRAKGATVSHRNFIHATQTSALKGALGAAQVGLDPLAPRRPVVLLVGPLFHISGSISLLGTPWASATVVFPPPGRWDEERHLEMTERYGIGAWSAVPTHYWRILEHPDLETRDLSSLQTASSGGAVFPPALVRAFQERLPHVVLSNGYGMTETCGLGTIAAGPLVLEHPDSVGTAWPTHEIEVRGPDGRALGSGQVGEIHIRAPSVFLGYWENPEATEAAIDEDGWYHTGDFGVIEGGLLFLESRMRDLIIRGGENIYPPEIENRLIEHPDVTECAVVGVPHRALGQEVKAFVVLHQGAEVSGPEIQSWVADALAPFKVPAYVEFRDALPHTETGKVMKHELETESPKWPLGSELD